jgi:protein-tyrosine phosphatase
MNDPRVLPLGGVHNFRDYGGYDTGQGARIKHGLLWRSAQHGDASKDDLEAIHALGIANVIDLRGPIERDMKPCRRHEDFAGQVWSYPEETAGLALHTEAADGVISAQEARAAMIRLYQGIAFRENLVPMLRLYFEILPRGEGSRSRSFTARKDPAWSTALPARTAPAGRSPWSSTRSASRAMRSCMITC